MSDVSGLLSNAKRMSPENLAKSYLQELYADTFAEYLSNLKRRVQLRLSENNSWRLLISNSRTGKRDTAMRHKLLPSFSYLSEPAARFGSDFVLFTISAERLTPDLPFLDPDEDKFEPMRSFPGLFLGEFDSHSPRVVIFKLVFDFRGYHSYPSDTKFYQFIEVPFNVGFPIIMSAVAAYCAELDIHSFLAYAQDRKEKGNFFQFLSQRSSLYFDEQWSPVITSLENRLQVIYSENMNRILSLGSVEQALERAQKFLADHKLNTEQVDADPKLRQLFEVICGRKS